MRPAGSNGVRRPKRWPASTPALPPPCARPAISLTPQRPDNHPALPGIAQAVKAIAAFPQRPQILWPLHPSPQVGPVIRPILEGIEGIRLTEPLDYAATVAAV